ncbi:phosphate regulon response regulator PhoB [Streptococcus criceti]|uniref:Phosphate regulon response regulator PhoB n=1 Tax=Streptococcus criceti HS-6 TaxID=873449 RepID=G5JNX9_STRCG|nr:response regulator transcription factor [Streptococcus criceti]EHI75328.1 phosphate regulon response regulator PhoB [Streptococcus criceti HS-6]SUN43390.1 phosphate regulon response regulator PhoB [Streptococcus criceti]
MIYCVEDDDDIRELVIYTLQTAGFDAKGFESSAPFWAALKLQQPQLILLDIMMPDEDGLSILKKLKEKSSTKDIPVIMATAKGTEFDKVKGLDLGADDYLVKPFGMMEMISRIKAVLRRSRPKDSSLQLGIISLDSEQHLVTVGDQRLTLTRKEFDLLEIMMRYPKRVFSRQELLDAVWGEQAVLETRTVDVHIGTLRTKLGESGSSIQTVRGIGYRMEVEDDT